MIALGLGASWSLHQKPHVVVQMGIFARGIHFVDVEVQGLGPDAQTVDTGLLGGLSQRHRGQIGVTVSMPPGLQPSTELGVE